MEKKILECSTRGDKRFSAFVAKIDVCGKIATIEEHYQTSKVFLNELGKLEQYTLKTGKGKNPILFKVGEQYFNVKYLSNYFDLLWFKYLEKNPSLVKILSQYDDYNDMFKGKNTINCQADSIRKYMKQGREFVLEETKELRSLMSKSFFVIEGDIFKADTDIIGHQVNCLGKMGGGIATTVKNECPNVYNDYVTFCKSYYKKEDLLGKCLIVPATFFRYEIANLFGQLDVNKKNEPKEVRTKYDKLEEALVSLRNHAMRNGKQIALPYLIGCGAACGDWDKVTEILNRVFKVYPIILYKYTP